MQTDHAVEDEVVFDPQEKREDSTRRRGRTGQEGDPEDAKDVKKRLPRDEDD